MRSKKGVELSMNLIIIAAIALLVLVIVAVLVLRGSTNVANQTGCTAQPQGECVAAGDACPGEKVYLAASCPTATPKCCALPVQ